MSKVTKTFQFGEREFTLETGEIARQADSAIIASCGDTTVMVTVVNKMSGQPRDFMPLTIDVEERTYAAGKIPGGFFRREGRPSEKAILTCRLIDRPLRPLFPKGFGYDVQVVITIVSIDPNIDTEIVSLVGASAALERQAFRLMVLLVQLALVISTANMCLTQTEINLLNLI